MGFKESDYNYYIIENEYAIIHNSYTGKILKVNQVSLLKEIISGQNQDQYVDNALFKRLYADGFIVDSDTDEECLGKMSFMDKIYSNTLSITILPTEQCNFRCKYCYEDYKHGSMQKNTIENFTKYLKKNIAKYNRLSIDWFGGEPLLALNVIEELSEKMIPICQKHQKPYTASMTTNGYLLDVETFRKLLKCRINSFQITLDGYQELHDQIRILKNGGPTFQTILNNLKNIRDNIKSATFTIILRTNVTKDLLKNMDAYLRLLYNEFGKDTRFAFLFRPTGDWGGDVVKSIKDRFVRSSEELFTPIINSEYPLNYNFHVNFLNNRTCDAASRNSFVVGADGTIYKCTMLFNEDFNRIGKLDADGKLNIDLKKLSKWVSPEEVKHEKCNNCKEWSICQNRTCPAQYFTGNAKGNCGHEKNGKNFILKLLDKSNSPVIRKFDEEVVL